MRKEPALKPVGMEDMSMKYVIGLHMYCLALDKDASPCAQSNESCVLPGIGAHSPLPRLNGCTAERFFWLQPSGGDWRCCSAQAEIRSPVRWGYIVWWSRRWRRFSNVRSCAGARLENGREISGLRGLNAGAEECPGEGRRRTKGNTSSPGPT
jgi:hypothetical protein